MISTHSICAEKRATVTNVLPAAPNPEGTVVVGGKGKLVVREGVKTEEDDVAMGSAAASRFRHSFSRGLGRGAP